MKSLVVPIYRNAEGIADLLAALTSLARSVAGEFEVVFVIDGSPDNSGELLVEARSGLPFATQIIFHSRNFGAFTAIRTGLEFAKGTHIAVMAADLQEPPELIIQFFEILDADAADIVFGRRVGRDDPLVTRLLSGIFWTVYRRFVFAEIPPGGIDIFGCNSKVRDAVLEIEEQNSSLIAQLIWVGFRRRFVDYRRRARVHGKSAWGIARRYRYMMDSIFSYSELPIILILWAGVLGCGASLIIGAVTLMARFSGAIDHTGYATVVLLILFFGSLGLVVQGMIGCYLWRTMENSKRRPLRIVSQIISE